MFRHTASTNDDAIRSVSQSAAKIRSEEILDLLAPFGLCQVCAPVCRLCSLARNMAPECNDGAGREPRQGGRPKLLSLREVDAGNQPIVRRETESDELARPLRHVVGGDDDLYLAAERARQLN